MSFIPGRIACSCSGFLHESFICLFLFFIVVMRHKYLSLAGWRAWVSSWNRHGKKGYLCQEITLGLSLEIPPQLLNIEKNLAADSQGSTRGLLLLEPCVTTFGSVIIKLLFSHVCLNAHVFIFFHKLLWLAHDTKEKRGDYSFPQPRRGTEVTEWVLLWEAALSSRSAHKCDPLIREWDPCLLLCHKCKMFSPPIF